MSATRPHGGYRDPVYDRENDADLIGYQGRCWDCDWEGLVHPSKKEAWPEVEAHIESAEPISDCEDCAALEAERDAIGKENAFLRDAMAGECRAFVDRAEAAEARAEKLSGPCPWCNKEVGVAHDWVAKGREEVTDAEGRPMRVRVDEDA